MTERPPTPGAVARVILDLDIPHLDRPFDYSIPKDMAVGLQVGSLVRVKWGAQRFNAWVVEVAAKSEHGGPLAPILRLLSAEPLFTPRMLETYRYLAVRFASTLSQVLSLAIPPRRAKTEKNLPPVLLPAHRKLTTEGTLSSVTALYPAAREQLSAPLGAPLPRLVATAVPHETTASLLALLGHYSARGVPVIVLLPTLAAARACYKAVVSACGAAAVSLTDSSLPAGQRYETHLRALRGDLAAVIGTRSAVWTPFKEPAVTVIWDDGSSHYRERRNPQLDVLDVAVARCRWEGYGLVAAAYGRSLKAQLLVESQWATEAAPNPARVRDRAPRTQVTTPDSFEREGFSAFTSLPESAYTLIRQSLREGPVLIQVPGAGRAILSACRECGAEAACPECGGRLAAAGNATDVGRLVCLACGREHPGRPCAQCGEGLELRQVGADRVGRELGRAFPRVPVVVSATSAQIHREVTQDPKIVVATPGAEPRVPGGYAGVIISDADVSAYAESLGAGEEALRRWMNALALSRPRSAALLSGEVPPQLSRAVVMWRPGDYAALALEERRQVGFFPARWMVAIEGTAGEVSELVGALELLRLDGWQVVGSVFRPAQPAPQAPASPEPQEPGLFDLEQPPLTRTVVSCTPAEVSILMREIRALVQARSLQRKDPLRVAVNPPDLADS